MLKRLKARLGMLGSILALPLVLGPLLFASASQGGEAGDGDGEAGSGDGGDGNEASKGAPKTYDEAQVEKIVQQRLARHKATPPADYEDLKAAKTKLDEIEAASKTELQKAAERAEAADKKATEAAERANRTLRRSAVMVAAAKAGSADVDDVVALLEASSTKYGEVTVGDDGQVTGAEEAVKALLKAKPHLVGKSPTSVGSADGGPRGGGGDKPKTFEDAVSRAMTKSGT